MSVTPVQGTAEFTTEMLAKNFVTIDEHITRLTNRVFEAELDVSGLYSRLAQLDTRIDGLAPAKALIKKRRGRFVVGVAVGIVVAPVVYKQLAKHARNGSQVLQRKLDELKAEQAKQQAGAKTEQKPNTTA